MPAPLRLFLPILIVLELLYASIPAIMIMNLDFLRTVIVQSKPTLSNKDIEFAVPIVGIFVAGIHTLFIGLTIWLSVMIRSRGKWARVGLTLVLLIATLGSFASWTAGPMFYGIIIVTNIVHVILVGLLWLPQSVRNFFSA
ncbi:hypothetical protein [Gracilibacillus salinarum]|uniref:DUF2127 domain-containing protein n=1 Tax=Gracilibacillus salinarum TaxID=2932255 RepID=A0ABY4GGT3_9BACI|nr:hypothetical protein [Gracilibacillus salinarum]UOQ83530.1 hypothetical protein MUN87_12255 [Gracilibacillus salinarum]